MGPGRRVDVVIVGAGPAGAMTALLLRRARPDRSVLLLEGGTMPIHRPCGEYLGPAGVRVLVAAGIEDLVMATGARRIEGLSLHSSNGIVTARFSPVLNRTPACDHALGVRRERLDRCLQDAAAAAGVDLRRSAPVSNIVRDGSDWIVDSQNEHIRCGLVVGADGRQSLVRRRAGLDLRVDRKRFALVCRASGIEPPRSGLSYCEMHVGALGQIGIAPIGDGESNLNLLLAESSRVLLRNRSPSEVFHAALMATATLRGRCRRARLGDVLTTGSLPHASRSVISDGIALVGDAAGFCDPFTGDGMCFALRGAEMLASCLSAIDLRGQVPASTLAPYERTWRHCFAAKHTFSRGLQHLLSRRRLTEGAIGLLSRSPVMGRLMAAFCGDYLLH